MFLFLPLVYYLVAYDTTLLLTLSTLNCIYSASMMARNFDTFVNFPVFVIEFQVIVMVLVYLNERYSRITFHYFWMSAERAIIAKKQKSDALRYMFHEIRIPLNALGKKHVNKWRQGTCVQQVA